MLEGKCQATQDLAFSPGGLRLVAVGTGGAVRIWDLKIRQLIAQPKGHRNEVFRALFSPDGRVLVTAGNDSSIRLWDPVRIKETIDDRRVRQHLMRYVERANRAQRRLHWFLQRAGLETEPPPERPPWERPYATFEENREFLWRSLSSRFL